MGWVHVGTAIVLLTAWIMLVGTIGPAVFSVALFTMGLQAGMWFQRRESR